MFSGIIKALVKPIKLKKTSKSMSATLPIPKNWKVKEGESISVDGVCSTITRVKDNTFSVFYMPETLRKTTLCQLSNEHLFNLAQSLRLNDLIGGHLLSGHVDTTATLFSSKDEGQAKILRFSIPFKFNRYIVYKGSIAVNGVSLTVSGVDKKSFVVSLIPYTLQHTNLGKLNIRDAVNIEVDMLAKYLEKLAITKDQPCVKVDP